MAQRKWLVRPDHQIQTLDGDVIAAVSQEQLVKAVYDLAIVLDRAGGVGSIIVARTPTGVEGERVTTGALCEWKDRTDARPQPERDAQIPVEPPAENGHTPGDAELAQALVAAADSEAELPTVDEQDLPGHLRTGE